MQGQRMAAARRRHIETARSPVRRSRLEKAALQQVMHQGLCLVAGQSRALSAPGSEKRPAGGLCLPARVDSPCFRVCRQEKDFRVVSRRKSLL